jgi:hypothetical protein
MNAILRAFLIPSGEGNSFYAQKFKRTVSCQRIKNQRLQLSFSTHCIMLQCFLIKQVREILPASVIQHLSRQTTLQLLSCAFPGLQALPELLPAHARPLSQRHHGRVVARQYEWSSRNLRTPAAMAQPNQCEGW